MARAAKVYLVGAGPGDPDLLTLKAVRVLQQADVVIYDRLVSADVLALANPAATLVYAGKERGDQQRVQNEIFASLLRYAQTGKTIVRLKSGDPMVFGRGGEELAFLNDHGMDTEVIPGVSSVLAAPASAGIPLTYRGVAASFAVVTGHRENLPSIDWSAYRLIDTLVVLMGVECRDAIASLLIAEGRSPSLPVAFIENATTDRERVVESTLAQVARREVEVNAPAVFVIGKVVGLRHSLAAALREGVAA